VISVALLCLLALAGSPSVADTITPQSAIARLFTADKVDPDWFATSLLQQAPASQVQAVVDQLKAQLGAYQDVRVEGDHYVTVFAGGTVSTYMALDASGRILTLSFRAPVPVRADPTAALNTFKGLPGHVSLVIESGGAVVQSVNADEPLAVGSAFKLAVLAAIKKRADAHQMSWTQIAQVHDQWKSLPSGILQTWPDGAPLTLNSVAALMISQSDNTAADLALRTVGRNAVETEGPRNEPFLTTREAFILKDPVNAQSLGAWRKGNAAARRALLATLDTKPLPSVAIFSGGVIAQDIEWFFSVRDLCGLMAQVASLPLMSINPGVADPSRFTRVSYKGGSEPGVLNLTTQVTTMRGKTYCVSATWNDSKPLDEGRFELAYGVLLNSINN
jgi:beta-lactamase class A